MIGGIVSGGLLLRRRLGPPLLIGAVVGAAALVLLSNASIVIAAMVGLGMYAFGYFLVDVVITTLLQRVLPDAARGRGVGLLMTVGTLGEVVGSLALPVLVSTLGIGILAPASLILVGAAIVGLRLIGPAATRAPTEAEATLLRVVQDPLFAGIGAPAIERALGRLRTIPVVAGQVVVHQGEPADHFYLVQRGTLAVTQRDAGGRERELRTLGPGRVLRGAGPAQRRAAKRDRDGDDRRVAARPRRPGLPRAGRRRRGGPGAAPRPVRTAAVAASAGAGD